MPDVGQRARFSQETLGFFFGFVGVLAFSFTLPLTRLAVRELDPLFITSGRAVVAALVSLAALLLARSSRPPRAQLLPLAIAALGVVIGFPLFSALALRTLPAGHGAIVNALLPLATAVGGAFAQRQRPSWPFWLAAISGSLVVIGFILFNSGSGLDPADLSMLIAVALGAMGYVFGAQVSKVIGGWQTISWINLLCVPLMLPLALWSAPTQPVSSANWLAFAYLGVVSMCLGFFAWYHGLTLGGIARVSQIQLMQAFLSILWSGLLVGELITPGMWIAVTLVIICIFVARKAPIHTLAGR